jgi:hypothetical protein
LKSRFRNGQSNKLERDDDSSRTHRAPGSEAFTIVLQRRPRSQGSPDPAGHMIMLILKG